MAIGGAVADLQKAGSTGSAEPNFFQILRQICLVFREFISSECTKYKYHRKYHGNTMEIMDISGKYHGINL